VVDQPELHSTGAAPCPSDAREALRLVEAACAQAPRSGARASAKRLVRRELARAVFDALLLPARLAGSVLGGRAAREELSACLTSPARILEPPAADWPRNRPLRVLVSCAEVSGETHAANLVSALRRAARAQGAPEPRFAGLGGPRLAASGVECWHDTVSRAQMGFGAVLRSLWRYLRLLEDVVERSDAFAPDVVVAVDSPALHVPLFSMLRARGRRTVHLVAPQHWAWAGWRARRWARCTGLGLAILPFEPAWFARRGARVALVGHPQLDAIAGSAATVGSSVARRDTLVVLCGSRPSVVARHAAWMAELALEAAREGPWRVVVAHERAEVADELRRLLGERLAEGRLEVQSGDLHGLLSRARAALTVSGTITIDLLARDVPSVVVYRVAGRLEALLARALVHVPYIAGPNLLAGSSVMPEHAFAGAPPEQAILADLRRALADEAWRAACARRMQAARERLGASGAIERAAGWVAAIAWHGGGEG
jgi:lipid-A-disaccharide synthase